MSDWFVRAFGSALADIRQRCLEEPYFGKIVTPRSQTITLSTPGEKSPGEALGWTREPEEPDRGIDR